MKHDRGRFLWSDNSVYEGEFFNNNMHGKGKNIWPDVRTNQGDWKNNMMSGYGIFSFKDGRG